jgi:hypothetical protein
MYVCTEAQTQEKNVLELSQYGYQKICLREQIPKKYTYLSDKMHPKKLFQKKGFLPHTGS